MDIVGAIVSALEFLPDPLIIFILAMIPFGELRISIPVGIFVLEMGWPLVFVVSVLGNLLPVPIILVFFRRAEKWLRHWKFWDRFFERLFDRTVRRAKDRIHRYEEIALMLFVAIPAPFTGAWTGSLIAVLFDLEKKKSFIIIALGVITAGVVVTAISVFMGNAFGV